MPLEGKKSSRFSKSSPSGPVPEPRGAVDDEMSVMARVAPLTGRDTEVNLLKDRWEQANEGMGQVVLLIGEAGLGKSRLVHTLKEHVLGQMVEGEVDSPVIEWRCSPHFQNTGLHPAIDFYERALDFGLEKSAQAQFDRLLSRLEAYDLARPETLPLWASLLGLPTSDRFPPLSLSPTRLMEETFRVMREWLHTRAVRRPVLFVVEDLHWVDASTLEFLGQFLTEGLHDRILTVLTFRPEFKTPWPAVAHQTSLALNRLTRRQVGELLGKSAAASLPLQLIDQIHERTGGVPLFVEELARLVRESRRLDQAGGEKTRCDLLDHGLPGTLRDLVVTRLDGMTRNPEVAQLAANAAIAGRPDLMGNRTSLTVYPGMTGITENAFINVKNRSYTITAPVELRDANTNGVIIAQAGAFGGWVLYMKDGKVHHEYNFFGVERTNIASPSALSAGKHEIEYAFVPDAPKPGSGGKCTLFVDGRQVAEGYIPKTQPFVFSADEGVDVGMDGETAVSNDYKEGDNKFTGKIVKVTVDVEPSASAPLMK
jgi:hypothetical protein